MSLYRFFNQPSGFAVERLGRHRLSVQLQPWTLLLQRDGYAPERCSFYDGDRLTLLVAARLLGQDDTAPPRLSSAAREALALRTDVGLQRLRLLAQVDPAVHEIQLSALRLAGHVPPLAQEAALYREPYILKDIRTYPAAAIAFAYLQPELWRPPGGPGAAARSPELEEPEAPEAPVEDLLRAMADWRGLFSPDRSPYRSLNRTLMNLPPDLPPGLVCRLRRIRLERPVVDRLELLMVLLYADTLGDTTAPADASRFRTLHHAAAADIRNALAQVGTATDRPLRSQRLDDVRFLVRYLCDYPESFHGSLPALVERVIRWHRQACERQQLQKYMRELGGADIPAVPPPIALPAVPGVTFLATVGEIVEEGARMHHCIATRAQDALHGRCYLFHIDHLGEQASVEVSPRGSISEAQGPHNTDNQAVWWGAAQLRNWAAGLFTEPAPPRRRARRLDPNQLTLPFF